MNGNVRESSEKAPKVPWWKFVLGEAVFWLLALFGGAVVLLWNALSPRFSRYMEGDLGYLIMQILTTPIGVALAAAAIDSITKKRHPLLCLVNCVVFATLMSALLAFTVLWKTATAKNFISIALAVLVAIVCAVNFAKDNRKINK